MFNAFQFIELIKLVNVVIDDMGTDRDSAEALINFWIRNDGESILNLLNSELGVVSRIGIINSHNESLGMLIDSSAV